MYHRSTYIVFAQLLS